MSGHEPEQPLLVFIHIPKTAGTTARILMRRQFDADGFGLLGNMFKGHGGFSEGPLEKIEAEYGENGTATNVQGVSGHVPFAVSRTIARPAQYFTFLREPVDRVLSHYFYMRDGGKASRKPWQIDPSITLVDAVTRPELGLIYDNLQTRMLSDTLSPEIEATRAMLDEAKRNLERHFPVVGLVERFDESLALLRLNLGWRAVLYERHRANPDRPSIDLVSREELDVVRERNALDLELYDHVRQRFERETRARGRRLEVEVAAIRRAQALNAGEAVPPAEGIDDELLAARVDVLRAEMHAVEQTKLNRDGRSILERASEGLRAAEHARDRALQRAEKAEARVAKLESRLEKAEGQVAKLRRRLEGEQVEAE